MKLSVDEIRIDGGTQIRAQLDASRVAEYAEKYQAGVQMPAAVVYYDGERYWLADGFHRVEAQRSLGMSIDCEVRAGTRRDAVLCAVGANEEHGLPRSNADKRRAIETLLRDEEWTQWSDREIARACKVSDKTVAKIREESYPRISADSPKAPEPKPRKFKRGGKTHTQKQRECTHDPEPDDSAKEDEGDASAYDPGEDDESESVVAEVDDDPIEPESERDSRWGDFEMSAAVAAVVRRCRDFSEEIATLFDGVEASKRDEFAVRAEPVMLEVFEALQKRLPVTARRAEENRARMRVFDGGKQ